MSKQTAVEWFMDKIGEKQPNGLYVIDSLEDVQNVFKQAKAMEKEQLENSYFNGGADNMNDEGSFKEYYIETYGGDK
jgi:hypothetical protein